MRGAVGRITASPPPRHAPVPPPSCKNPKAEGMPPPPASMQVSCSPGLAVPPARRAQQG